MVADSLSDHLLPDLPALGIDYHESYHSSSLQSNGNFKRNGARPLID